MCYYVDRLSLSHFPEQERIWNESDEFKIGEWEEPGISASEDDERASGTQLSDNSVCQGLDPRLMVGNPITGTLSQL